MRPPSCADQANDLLRHLGDQLGLPSLCLDAQGRCLLLIGRRWPLALVLDPARDTLYLSCPVTTPQQLADIPPGAWMALLQTHHLGGRIAGASIAVDPEGRVCVQQALHLPSALPAQLLGAVEGAVSRAIQWSAQLGALSPSPSASFSVTPAAALPSESGAAPGAGSPAPRRVHPRV